MENGKWSGSVREDVASKDARSTVFPFSIYHFPFTISLMPLPIAVQLYTVRDLTAKDFAGTLKEVAKIGYVAVEMAGYGDLKTPADAREALDDAGLKVSGTHASIDDLEKDAGKVMDDAEAL